MKSLSMNQVNRPLVFALFALLALNSTWQTPYSHSLASSESTTKSNIGCEIKSNSAGVEENHLCDEAAKKATSSALASTAATANGDKKESSVVKEGTVLQKGEKKTEVLSRTAESTRTRETEEIRLDGKEVVNLPFKVGQKNLKMILTRTCEYFEATKESVCSFSAKLPRKEDRKALLDDHGVTSEHIKDDKNESCEKCFELSLDHVDGLNTEAQKTTDWFKEVRDRISDQYHAFAEGLKLKKDKDGKVVSADSKRNKDTQKKIYYCEWTPESTDESHEALKDEALRRCVEKRIAELSDKEVDAFKEKVNKGTISGLVKKVETHLKKCLANAEKRDDVGCLDLADSIKDSLLSSSNEAVHDLGHAMEYKVVRSQASIEDERMTEQLKKIRAGMSNAEMLAERTGNFGPMTMYQNQLGQLHQYFLTSQMRRQQFFSALELDPSVGLGTLNDLSADAMMMSRLEQEFQRAAMPNRFGRSGLMGRYGMPSYSPYGGQQIMPGMYPGMMPGAPGIMPGMYPGMMPGSPGIMPGMHPGMMPYGPRPYPMPYAGGGISPYGMPGAPMPYGGGVSPYPYGGVGAINPYLGGPRPYAQAPAGFGGYNQYGLYGNGGFGIGGNVGITAGAYIGSPGIYSPTPTTAVINTR